MDPWQQDVHSFPSVLCITLVSNNPPCTTPGSSIACKRICGWGKPCIALALLRWILADRYRSTPTQVSVVASHQRLPRPIDDTVPVSEAACQGELLAVIQEEPVHLPMALGRRLPPDLSLKWSKKKKTQWSEILSLKWNKQKKQFLQRRCRSQAP